MLPNVPGPRDADLGVPCAACPSNRLRALRIGSGSACSSRCLWTWRCSELASFLGVPGVTLYLSKTFSGVWSVSLRKRNILPPTTLIIAFRSPPCAMHGLPVIQYNAVASVAVPRCPLIIAFRRPPYAMRGIPVTQYSALASVAVPSWSCESNLCFQCDARGKGT